MPSLRRLSGREVIRIFESFGFEVISQQGSHVKLRRETGDFGRQTLVVPNHPEIDTGTLRSIMRQAGRYISEAELRDHFYA